MPIEPDRLLKDNFWKKMKDLKSLYETDYALWLDRTLEYLKKKEIDYLDWENLAEEINALSRSERHQLNSRLTNLLEHLIKRKYIKLPDCYRGWVNTITREQQELEFLLDESPSLLNVFNQRFVVCWKNARKRILREYDDVDVPLECPFPSNPDRLLNDIFWE